MTEATVIAKSTGEDSVVDLEVGALEQASVIILPIARGEVAGFQRQGDDLVLQLASGEAVVIRSFFVASPDGQYSEHVLVEEGCSYRRLRAVTGVEIVQFSELKTHVQRVPWDGPGGVCSAKGEPVPAVGSD